MKMKYLRIANEHIFSLLIPLLWAAPLLLSAFGAHAGVIITRLYSFNAYNDGSEPEAVLVQGSDGNFYGTTYSSGAYDSGTVFKISAHGAYTHLYSFTGTNDGWGPTAGLVQGRDGSFYGTTPYGGSTPRQDGNGTVFKISTNGTLTTLHSFTGGADGGGPMGGLTQGSDGNFYGVTAGGGTNNAGIVYQITPTGVLTSLYSFTGGTDGANPVAGLTQGSDGNFYGTTYLGGMNNAGTVFQITPAGALTSLYSFTGGADGASPRSVLVQGSDGNFYGTTYLGGTNNAGTVFQITPAGALTSLYSFTGGAGGQPTDAGLVQGSDGNFYGTSWGGTYGYGTVFQVTPTGALTSLHSFGVTIDAGEDPIGGLVQGSDGSFYGTTSGGGMRGFGTVFRLTIAPPRLTITRSEANVILSWPTNYVGFDYSGYILQSTTNLGSSAVWTTNLPSPVVINGQYTLTNPITGTWRLYRLAQ
jgi:uncharacterized repeat protein (TIGR03803 family)